ncbi:MULTISPECIES: EexN family lipoprotein [unclassified Acidovorax]|uniref:EexN family lipoprotein n=1 Tax=unclassified Acidovorax TaxID=2684926 RepID=UPI001C4517BB|nr:MULTISPECIES: EexN family lipoprotein [unclassified Acidovorax]MBV7427342.1 EexN family lipoprotein [Acidovorax sp. sif0732]MBV7448466.1 EexN family lipoprotein [Acidovorax sp. sif0715]
MKFKYLLIMSVALLVAGCDKTPAIETVESLVVNSERLRELRARCKADHAKVGDAQCNAVAEATRQRFMSGGTAHIPAAPQPASSPASAASSDTAKD